MDPEALRLAVERARVEGKTAKIAGFYWEEPSKRARPIQLTKVIVILDRGDQGITEEVTVLGTGFVAGEATLLNQRKPRPRGYPLPNTPVHAASSFKRIDALNIYAPATSEKKRSR